MCLLYMQLVGQLSFDRLRIGIDREYGRAPVVVLEAFKVRSNMLVVWSNLGIPEPKMARLIVNNPSILFSEPA